MPLRFWHLGRSHSCLQSTPMRRTPPTSQSSTRIGAILAAPKERQMPAKNEPPRVLVTGASGKVGGAVATALDGSHGEVIAVRASRRRETVEKWEQQGLAAAFLDLDDPQTF